MTVDGDWTGKGKTEMGAGARASWVDFFFEKSFY